MKTKLTISIVVYKGYGDAFNAVESIEKYTSKEICKKIYVVDNSMYEDDYSAKQDFISQITQYDDVVYIDTKQNLGFGKGHNYILDTIESEYHAIVNPDIILKEDAFDELLKFMDNDDTIGMCIPKLVDEKGEMQLAYRKYPTVLDMCIRMFFKKLFLSRQRKHTLQDQDFSKPLSIPFAQGSFLVIRTQLLKSLHGFDDRFFMYLEDADLCRRVNDISKVMYCPYTEVIHKWERASHKNFKLLRIHIKSLIYYFNKWGWSFF